MNASGYSVLPGNSRDDAFLYTGGVMRDLGTLGGTSSAGWPINAFGQITGQSATLAGNSHAFLFSSGIMADLNTLIDPGARRCVACQIVANGTNAGGQYRAFVLNPVPEPATFVLLAAALLCCAVHVTRA